MGITVISKVEALSRFGSNVAKLRSKRQLTQKELALRSSIDRSHISDIERGVKEPGMLMILRLASALGVSHNYIMEGL